MENVEKKKSIFFTFDETGYKPLVVFNKILFVLLVIALLVALISFIVAVMHTGNAGDTWEEHYDNNIIGVASWISFAYSSIIAFALFLQVVMLNVFKTILHTHILHRAVLKDKYDFIEN